MNKTQIAILEQLQATYDHIGSGLNFRNPFELLIATILSAQSTDVHVNKITPALFEAFPDAFSMSRASQQTIISYISSIGLYRNKSKNLIAASKMIVEDFNGVVPSCRNDLVRLPGVGRKTANVVLCFAFGVPAFAVDTHVFRVSQRLGFAKGKNVDQVEAQLTDVIPDDLWCSAHHWLIWHGRQVCKARNPLCQTCFLKELCPWDEKSND